MQIKPENKEDSRLLGGCLLLYTVLLFVYHFLLIPFPFLCKYKECKGVIKLKRLLSFILFFVLLFSLVVPCFAAQSSAKDTVNYSSLTIINPTVLEQGKKCDLVQFEGLVYVLFKERGLAATLPNMTYQQKRIYVYFEDENAEVECLQNNCSGFVAIYEKDAKQITQQTFHLLAETSTYQLLRRNNDYIIQDKTDGSKYECVYRKHPTFEITKEDGSTEKFVGEDNYIARISYTDFRSAATVEVSKGMPLYKIVIIALLSFITFASFIFTRKRMKIKESDRSHIFNRADSN